MIIGGCYNPSTYVKDSFNNNIPQFMLKCGTYARVIEPNYCMYHGMNGSLFPGTDRVLVYSLLLPLLAHSSTTFDAKQSFAIKACLFVTIKLLVPLVNTLLTPSRLRPFVHALGFPYTVTTN